MATASASQAKVTTDIKTVNADEQQLNAALQAAGGSSGAPGTGGTGGGGGGGGTHGGGTTSTTAPTATTTTTVPAAHTGSIGSTGSTGGAPTGHSKVATTQQLAVDQASIDAAQANLDGAEQALGGASLATTIAGTIASVGIAPGGSVSAGSSSSAPSIVVVGNGTQYQAVADVPVTHLAQVAVGQQAVVTPDVTDTALRGTVAAIGVLGTSSGSSTTYPVTIALDSPDLGGYSGAAANISIVTHRAVGVTTVPTSAVRTVGSVHLVTVLDHGVARPVRVTVGTVGDLRSQITSGLHDGEVVTLADLAQPVPSSSTTTGRFGLVTGGLGSAGAGAGAGAFRVAGGGVPTGG